MARRFTILLEQDRDAGVWVPYVPALGQMSTWGETRAEAIANTREAIVGYLEAAAREGIDVSAVPSSRA
jgi:predicted RNase H-like HicB family nuclease